MTTDYTHPEYDNFQPLWEKVRDACAGEDTVKAAGTKYLPNPDETSEGSRERYERYRQRAVYLNATGRTLMGLVGIAFANWPAITTKHKVLLTDADGSGVGLIGQSQGVLSGVLQAGRAGLLADWTRGDGISRRLTVAQFEAAGRRPFLVSYTAEQILTWERQGLTLTRVVLAEQEELHEDGKVRFRPRLRELLLTNKGYTIKVWVKYTDSGDFILKDTMEVGLGFIPFSFVGATNNDSTPDTPPLLDLANLNLAHYRNSADYEESAFLMGQPQMVIAGVTEEWVKERGPISFGARAAIPLPVGGSAELLQVNPNTLAKEAMADKERMMASLGARLVTPGEVVKTATQSAAETKSAYSQLSLACDNVSEAYTKALQWLETWGNGTSNASFALDTRFNDLTLDSNAIQQTVAAWQAGLVPQSDAWAVLRRLGVLDQGKTDEQLRAEIDAQGPTLNLDEAA